MTKMPADTVKACLQDADPKILLHGDWHHSLDACPSRDKTYRDEWHLSFKFEDRAHFYLVFRPQDHYSAQLRNCLNVQISSPAKILGECNHGIIQDWDATLDRANEILSRQLGTGAIDDIRNGVLYRVDPSAVLSPIGADAADYIAAGWLAHYRGRERLPYIDEDGFNTGVVYKPRKRKLSASLYRKYLRCGHDAAWNLITFEISIRAKGLITKKFGKKDLTVGELTPEPLWDLLERDLRVLGFDRPIAGDIAQLEEALRAVRSPRQVRSMLDYAVLKHERGIEYIRKTGMSRQSISRREGLFKRAGITSFYLDGRDTVPPLLLALQALRHSCEGAGPGC